MIKIPSLYQVLFFAGIVAIIFLLIFDKDPAPIYKISNPKTIVNRIESKEKDVSEALERSEVDKKLINSLLSQMNLFKIKLDQAKTDKDSVQIIKLQDVIIYSQDSTISRYQLMDKRKDSVIIDQRYIINSKDTLIAIKDYDLKKIKKQRNRSLLLNVIQTGVITGLVILK